MARKEPHWVKLFLRELERTGNVRLAAEGAGVDYTTAYQRRKRHADFAEAWEGALERFKKAPPPSPPSRGRSPSPSTLTRGQGGAELIARPDGKVIKGSEARWGKRAEESFLTELTVSANVRRAAEAAGFSTAAVYKRRLKDRRFMAAWDAAVEAGKARVQAYLVEAATRTFDPDELPIADGAEVPKVSISEAINIAKLGSASPGNGRVGPSGGWSASGRSRRGERGYDDDGFDATPITREEWEGARQNIFNRLQRLREQMAEEERETGRCRSCGQVLPEERLALTSEEISA